MHVSAIAIIFYHKRDKNTAFIDIERVFIMNRPPFFMYPPMPPPPPPFPMQTPGYVGKSGGILSSLFPSGASSGQSLSTVIPTIQKVLNTAQTVTPMVKQYYPLVKQLPMLWKMLSAASKSNDANEEGQEAISTEEKTDVKNK